VFQNVLVYINSSPCVYCLGLKVVARNLKNRADARLHNHTELFHADQK